MPVELKSDSLQNFRSCFSRSLKSLMESDFFQKRKYKKPKISFAWRSKQRVYVDSLARHGGTICLLLRLGTESNNINWKPRLAVCV